MGIAMVRLLSFCSSRVARVGFLTVHMLTVLGKGGMAEWTWVGWYSTRAHITNYNRHSTLTKRNILTTTPAATHGGKQTEEQATRASVFAK